MKYQVPGLWPVRAGFTIPAGAIIDFTGPRDFWSQHTLNAEGLIPPPGAIAMDQEAVEYLSRGGNKPPISREAVNQALEEELKSHLKGE